MFLKDISMTREELLQTIVDDYIYQRSNHTSTLLGEPKEITLAKGKLIGVCMALGLEYEEVENQMIFKTFSNGKVVEKIRFEQDCFF